VNHYVYLLRSDRHFYIGIRSCPGSVEQDPYMGSGVAITDAKRAGIVFVKTILCVCSSREEASQLEAELVTEETLREPGCLNLQTGGKNGLKPLEETRLKMSLAHRGKRMPLEQRMRQAAAMRGRKQTPEHIAKTTAAKIGKKRPLMPQAAREALRAAAYRSWGNPEIRARLMRGRGNMNAEVVS
jgi:hypothetical protein